MKVLMVCLSDPRNGEKGDTKLVKKRQIVLEKMNCEVDILYFKWRLYKNDILVKRDQSRRGVDIVVHVSACKIVLWMMAELKVLAGKPIQTWFSFAVAATLRDKIEDIFSRYSGIHFYHIRSIGLWKLTSERTRVIADLIDSYTLNIGSRIGTEHRWWAKILLREEYKRIACMELEIEDYFKNRLKSTIIAVAAKDLEYIGGCISRKEVVPVGIDIEDLHSIRARGESLKCIFFGNLDYGPNIDACHVIGEVARELRRRGLDGWVKMTVAGRNISMNLKRMLIDQGVEVRSPVESMSHLVKKMDVAVLPMLNGSGMQSKVLEAISWGVLVVATSRTAFSIDLLINHEFTVLTICLLPKYLLPPLSALTSAFVFIKSCTTTITLFQSNASHNSGDTLVFEKTIQSALANSLAYLTIPIVSHITNERASLLHFILTALMMSLK